MPLQGKHALITGSSRGIGRGIALKLAEQRVNIAVHYHTQVDAAHQDPGAGQGPRRRGLPDPSRRRPPGGH